MGHLPPELKQSVHEGIDNLIPEIEERFGGEGYKLSKKLRKALHKYVPRLMDELDVAGVMALTIILSRFTMAALEQTAEQRERAIDHVAPPEGLTIIERPPVEKRIVLPGEDL
jgi:hypothetical protein